MTFWEAHAEREAAHQARVAEALRAERERDLLQRLPVAATHLCCGQRFSIARCEPGECEVIERVLS